MERYMFNNIIHGYTTVTINDFDDSVLEKTDNILVMFIDKSCDADTGKYYKVAYKTLKSNKNINNRLILIGANDGNKTFKPLASLMVTYNAYDIYEVDEKETVSAEELITMEKREPDITEVQTYIGGDVTAYSDMSTILFGIESLVDEGNTDKLKTFLEEHLNSIENLTSTLNSMKKTCDMAHSDELLDKIDKLKYNEDKLNKQIQDKDKTAEAFKHDMEKYQVEALNLRKKNEELLAKTEDLERSAGDGSVIRSYSELKIQIMQNKVKVILYFKEISYVRYTNTLMLILHSIFSNLNNMASKLIIYDSGTRLYETYNPIQLVSSDTYSTLKSTIKQRDKLLISEPNQMILQDLLESTEAYPLIIIYDRMKDPTDLVSGNNVEKFYVVGSTNDFKALSPAGSAKARFNMRSNPSRVITYADSHIMEDIGGTDKGMVLDIPHIKDFPRQQAKGTLQSAALAKYLKLNTALSKKNLIKSIIDSTNIRKQFTSLKLPS